MDSYQTIYVGGTTITVVGLIFTLSVFLLNYNRNHFSVLQSLVNTLFVAIPFVFIGIRLLQAKGLQRFNVTESLYP